MIGVFFGSTNGNTQDVAEQLAKQFAGQAAGPFNVLDTPVAKMNEYSRLLLGISTWNEGELQDDWEVCWKDLEAVQWQGKKVALFGCGDQVGYPETFQDAMGMLYQLIYGKGGHLYGYTNPAGYTVGAASKAMVNGWLCGLAIDNDNQADQTETRIASWAQDLRGEFMS